MNSKEERVRVRVRFVYPKYPDGSREVLAVFRGKMSERHCQNGVWLVTCYAHIGQHGACCETFARRKKATPEQYTPLLAELRSIGYDVTIV